MKIMEVELKPENVEKITFDPVMEVLTFKTNIKGPAGSTLYVKLPQEALLEANVAFNALLERRRTRLVVSPATNFPSVFPIVTQPIVA